MIFSVFKLDKDLLYYTWISNEATKICIPQLEDMSLCVESTEDYLELQLRNNDGKNS